MLTAHVDARPLQAFEQGGELRRRQTHDTVLDRRPAELRPFQPLGDEADAGAVPEQQLHLVGKREFVTAPFLA